MEKILIIEDDVDMIEVMKVVLQKGNYVVITAFDPEEGFQKIKEEKPDLLILDVMFGSEQKTKGFDFAYKMKQDKELAKIPILMITAVNIKYPQFGFSPETDKEYLPVDDFIDKPVQPEALLKKVEELLKQKVSKWANWPDKKT
ncbi:MAG: response regulator [Candidatus Omnitrophica bacterium]|nr:response regulator [Candidatus Omnitrophota bacterium]